MSYYTSVQSAITGVDCLYVIFLMCVVVVVILLSFKNITFLMIKLNNYSFTVCYGIRGTVGDVLQ